MNVAQITSMYATLYGLKNIFFSGSFLRDHPLIWENLSSAIRYWSKGEMRAMFLLHDGYLGALGALLEGSSCDENGSNNNENGNDDDDGDDNFDPESPDHKRLSLSGIGQSQLKL